MGGFFKVDGPFYKFGNALADVMILSVLWLLTSLPLITIGASTTSLFYAMTKRVAGNAGGVTGNYFKSFRREFLKSTALFAVIALLFLLIVWAARTNLATPLIPDGIGGMIFQIIVYADFIELAMVTVFIFPILARFELGFVGLIKNAFFMANRHLLHTIAILVFLVVLIAVVMTMPPVIVFVPGVFAYLTSFLFIRVFKRYHPEIVPSAVSKDLAPLNLEVLGAAEIAANKEAVTDERDK